MRRTNFNSKEIIACLIPVEDFPKFQLLANIAFEEGASLIEIRIPIDSDYLDIESFSKTSGKIILALDPTEVRKKNNQKKTEKLLEEMMLIAPYGIEINADLNEKIIQATIEKARMKECKLIIAKYYDSFLSQTKMIDEIKRLRNYNTDMIKLNVKVKDGFETTKLLLLHQEFENLRLIINPSGTEAKIGQILSPFYGSLFTYGYISQKMPEAQISISYLKKTIESIKETI